MRNFFIIIFKQKQEITSCKFFTQASVYKDTNFFREYRARFELKLFFLRKIDNKIYSHFFLFPTDFRKKFWSPEKILINHLMSHGKAYKVKNFLKIAYTALYSLIFFENPYFLKKKYQLFDAVSQIILSGTYWQNFNNLIFFFLDRIQPLFFIKSVSILNKFKKKKKSLRTNTFHSFLCKVPKYKRFNFTAREFCLFINSLNKYNCYDRISLGLLDLLFLNKKSFLYRKKVDCYKKVLKQFISTGHAL